MYCHPALKQHKLFRHAVRASSLTFQKSFSRQEYIPNGNTT